MSESILEKLRALRCPHLGLNPNPETLKHLLFHSEDRIPILQWILSKLKEKLKENKENHEDQGHDSAQETPVLNLHSRLDDSVDLEQNLKQLGYEQATDFVRMNLIESQSLGIWNSLILILDSESAICSKEEFQKWLSHPLTGSNGSKGQTKLIPRDIERELPSNYKKLAVPSAAKSAEIIQHFQRELESIQSELEDPTTNEDLDIAQEEAIARQELAILESTISDFSQFNLEFETTTQRLLLNKDDSVPESFGKPLEMGEEAMTILADTVVARETIQKVILDTNEWHT